MFDAVGVSERTRKPWTVLVSFIGECGLVGMAILVPMVATDALPHGRFVNVFLPEPPPPAPHATAAPHKSPANTVPFESTPTGIQQPTSVPVKVAAIIDPDSSDVGDPRGGVVGGTGPGGPANAVIESVLQAVRAPAPPPPAVVQKPTPAARLAAPVPVGGKVQMAKLVFGPKPTYPPLARAARVSGTVRLHAIISSEGAIVDLRVITGHPLLIPAAISAVKQWLFQPTTLNGVPVEVVTDIDVNFTLQQ
ncbi:MAG: energy transducer TonB [Bryobacteraceae bacterium]